MPYAKKENKNRESFDKSDGKGGMRTRRARKKICAFCMEKATNIDYKEISKLRKFVSERGKILPRRISGNCAKHQRQLTEAIKRARHIALLPFTAE
jgi:small subunit ribosomal protein S18